MPQEPKLEVFTEKEMKSLMLQFSKVRGDKGFTEKEFLGLLNQASETRLANDLLDMVLSGRMGCDWDGKEMLIQKI